MSDEEVEVKNEVEDYVDDLEETTVLSEVSHVEDPDYVPSDVDLLPKKKDKKEKKKQRGDSKGKKRKSG